MLGEGPVGSHCWCGNLTRHDRCSRRNLAVSEWKFDNAAITNVPKCLRLLTVVLKPARLRAQFLLGAVGGGSGAEASDRGYYSSSLDRYPKQPHDQRQSLNQPMR